MLWFHNILAMLRLHLCNSKAAFHMSDRIDEPSIHSAAAIERRNDFSEPRWYTRKRIRYMFLMDPILSLENMMPSYSWIKDRNTFGWLRFRLCFLKLTASFHVTHHFAYSILFFSWRILPLCESNWGINKDVGCRCQIQLMEQIDIRFNEQGCPPYNKIVEHFQHSLPAKVCRNVQSVMCKECTHSESCYCLSSTNLSIIAK